MHWLLSAACFSALTSAEADNSLLWGPYRPNVYFGMRPRIPESFMSGLMWYETNDLAGLGNIRHDVMNEDNVARFGWTAYDPRTGGQQVVYDKDHHIKLITELVKSEDGLSWQVKVTGEQDLESIVTTVWYLGLESAGPSSRNSKDFIELSPKSKQKLSSKGIEGNVDFHGFSQALGGRFKVSVSEGKGDRPSHDHEWDAEKPASKSHYFGLSAPSASLWRARDIFLTLVQDQVSTFLAAFGQEDSNVPPWAVFSLADDDKLGGNLHYVQKTFKGPFEYTVTFTPENSSGFSPSETFEDRLQRVFENQAAKLENSLKIQAPFTNDNYKAFAREMISSIAGGIGYFYGDSLLASGDEAAPERTAPHELFTGTPSRAFFPRGFYWDEGFNALALMDFDTELVLEIIASWFKTMNSDGYIEREQILGDEARNRVPPEFQIQDPTVANPPTLVMALAHLGSTTKSDKSLLAQFYPALKTHFNWFTREQRGETISYDREFPSKEVYRWRGRTPTHILASGLDDYPRAPEVSDGELHVDLAAWVGAMATSLARIADILDIPEDAAKYAGVVQGIQQNLDAVFWNEDAQAYCDVSVDEWEEDSHVCHIGYVTHLPFFLKLVPESNEKQLLAVLDDLRDPEQLWSKGGIRSLSKSDEFFGTDENYWRGAVWNNMNFLALDALRYYGTTANTSPEVKNRAAEIYKELRLNTVKNIYYHWKSSGYVWESYDGITGEPKGAKAFTGWAGLVANIMAMPETLEEQHSHSEHDEL